MRLSKLMIFNVIFLLCFCGIEKSTEYWLKTENQDGRIVDFFVSDEYCLEAIRISKEFEQINHIDSTITVILSSSKTDSSSLSLDIFLATKSIDEINLEVYYQLATLKEELVAASGGYCPHEFWDDTKDFPLFPLLPYRTVTNKQFWSESRNRTAFKNALVNFDSDLNLIGKQYGYQENSNILQEAFPTQSPTTHDQIIDDLLLENHTLGAIHTLKLIQLATVKKMIRFKTHILTL